MRYVVSALLLVACGGGAANTQADHGQGPSQGGASSADAAGPSTTTTVLLGDGGELQGSRLESTQGPVTLDGGTSATHVNPNERDPGRRREDIEMKIHLSRPAARACYDAELATHPGIQGNIDITWKLDPKGAVVETGVNDAQSDIHDAALVKCIGDVIRSIPWAPSPRGVETTVHYPFNFRPHR